MKCLTISSPPDIQSLELEDAPIPVPDKNQALIKLQSIGLNRGDLLFCQNRYFHKPQPGSRLGFEGAGVIEAIAEGSDLQFHKGNTLQVGDRVAICPMSFNVNEQGCLSDYGVYNLDTLIPTPHCLSDQEAGAIWMAFLTAWGGMVEAGELRAGESVVITAASSSVGIAAIQIANMLGAHSIATTTSEDKAQALRKLGAQDVIVMSRSDNANEEYVESLYRCTQNRGSDLVFDAVAGPATHGLIKASKRGGRLIIQGMLDRRPMDIHAGVLMKRLLTIKGYTLDQTLNSSDQKQRAIETISRGFEQGQLTPHVASTHSLSDFAQAFKEISANKHIGKIVVTP